MANKKLKEMFLELTALAFQIREFGKDFINLELSNHGPAVVVTYRKNGFSRYGKYDLSEHIYNSEELINDSISNYENAVKVLTERIEELKNEEVSN